MNCICHTRLRCRNLRDVGRSVSAFGFWGDILNSPYHAFGTVADDPALFKLVNKQFSHTALDVAEHNVLVSRRAPSAARRRLRTQQTPYCCWGADTI